MLKSYFKLTELTRLGKWRDPWAVKQCFIPDTLFIAEGTLYEPRDPRHPEQIKSHDCTKAIRTSPAAMTTFIQTLLRCNDDDERSIRSDGEKPLNYILEVRFNFMERRQIYLYPITCMQDIGRVPIPPWMPPPRDLSRAPTSRPIVEPPNPDTIFFCSPQEIQKVSCVLGKKQQLDDVTLSRDLLLDEDVIIETDGDLTLLRGMGNEVYYREEEYANATISNKVIAEWYLRKTPSASRVWMITGEKSETYYP